MAPLESMTDILPSVTTEMLHSAVLGEAGLTGAVEVRPVVTRMPCSGGVLTHQCQGRTLGRPHSLAWRLTCDPGVAARPQFGRS